MAIYGKKVSELEEILQPTGEEFIPVQVGGTNKKIKANKIGINEIEISDGVEPTDESVKLWVDLSENGEESVSQDEGQNFSSIPSDIVVGSKNLIKDSMFINESYYTSQAKGSFNVRFLKTEKGTKYISLVTSHSMQGVLRFDLYEGFAKKTDNTKSVLSFYCKGYGLMNIGGEKIEIPSDWTYMEFSVNEDGTYGKFAMLDYTKFTPSSLDITVGDNAIDPLSPPTNELDIAFPKYQVGVDVPTGYSIAPEDFITILSAK